MPTTYTHDYFGKKVYQKLPEEMKRVIRENGELYRIGLHGPDILFYYMVSKNPVTQFGINMHREKGRAFFEQGMETVRRTGDQALLAYLLGFGCHYLLDSYCHPYVDEVAEAGVISHTVLEKEYDRFLMEESGKNPYIYRPSDCIVPRYQWAKEIHKVLPTVKTINIYISMKMMKILTNLMVCNDGEKRRKREASQIDRKQKRNVSSGAFYEKRTGSRFFHSGCTAQSPVLGGSRRSTGGAYRALQSLKGEEKTVAEMGQDV